MSASIPLWDIIGKAQCIFMVCVRPLQGNLNGYSVSLSTNNDRFSVEGLSRFIKILYESFGSTFIMETCCFRFSVTASVRCSVAPLFRKANSRKRCSSVSNLYSIVVKIEGDARKVTSVPVRSPQGATRERELSPDRVRSVQNTPTLHAISSGRASLIMH